MQAEVPNVHPDILIVVSTINLTCKYVHYKLHSVLGQKKKNVCFRLHGLQN